MAKKTDFKNLSAEELRAVAQEKREALRGLRFGSAGSKNKNVKAVRALRKDIARALTAFAAQKSEAQSTKSEK